MKFLERDFARAASLYCLFVENNDIEKLSKKEKDRFYFLIYNFLCLINFKKCSVKLNSDAKVIKVKLIGDKKDDVYIVLYDISSEYSSLLPVILKHDPENKTTNEFLLKLRKYLEKFTIDLTMDIGGKITFKLNVI